MTEPVKAVAASPYATWQRLVAEFVGTFTWVFVGVAAIVASKTTGGGASGAGLVTIALAEGLAVAAMMSAVGHVSGAHFNPAMTVGAWITGKISSLAAFLYIVAQLGGATAAAAAIRGSLPESMWRVVQLGTPGLDPRISVARGLVLEGVLAFFLVWVIFATAVDGQGAFNKVGGIAVGFVVVADVLAGGPFTGAAMNPARAFGPALIGGYWDHHLVYWVGPIAGASLAALVYELVVLRPRRQAA